MLSRSNFTLVFIHWGQAALAPPKPAPKPGPKPVKIPLTGAWLSGGSGRADCPLRPRLAVFWRWRSGHAVFLVKLARSLARPFRALINLHQLL